MRRNAPLPLAATFLCVLAGCVHSMRVKNLDEFTLQAATAQRYTLRVAAEAPDQAYGRSIEDGLTKHASVKHVVHAGDSGDESKPDADVQAKVSVKYSGSGLNFPITFPGFLLFAHAWNGYVYKAEITTELSVAEQNGTTPRTRTLKTEYDMRHCDFGRGFWASSGWFLPGWGATSLLAGFFMVSYDDDATPLFENAVGDAYGSYVANNVVEMLAEDERQARATP